MRPEFRPPIALARTRTLDLRLVTGAGAAWLAALVALGHSPAAVLIAALVSAGMGIGLLRLAARGIDAAATLALVAFCLALVLVPLAGRLAHYRRLPVVQLAHNHAAVSAELTVTADPRPLAAKGVAGSPRVAVDTAAAAVSIGGRRIPTGGDVMVLGPAQPWQGVLPGQRVRLDGSLSPPLDRRSLSVTLFARDGPDLIGSPPWWQRTAGTIRASLRRAASGLPADTRGLLPGLVDGDTSDLDPVLAEHFRLAGLTHLVAVSGTNCSILIGSVLLVLRRFGVRPWLSGLAGALVLVVFVAVARPSPSVLRAALMAAIAMGALAGGRARHALPTLAATVLALLLWDPRLAANPGFAMSVLATAALLVLAPGWALALRQRRVPAGIAELVAVAAAATLVTAPIIAAIAGRVSLVSIPANVLAEPVVAIATVFGFAAAVVAPLWLAPAQLLAWLAGWPCRWLVWVANFFGSLHGATLPWPGGLTGGLALLVLLVGVLAAAARAGPRRCLAAAAVAAVIILIPVRSVTSGWPPPHWMFVACDVGQGDALLLAAAPHAAIEIDAGPDPVAIDRCLHDLGITDVPLLIFTHYHLDHVGGVSGVFAGRRVDAVLAGPLAEPASGVHLVQTALQRRGLRVGTPAVGQRFDVGRVHLDVLAPRVAFHNTRSDPNNSSLVLRATIDGERIMLPGDAEIDAQQSLVASGADLRSDVLKVPHHGSAYFDPGFLAAVHAHVAVISVGRHNDYGHPSPMLLAELARLGVPVRRTDRDGDVAVVADRGSVSTVVRGKRWSTVGEVGRAGTAPVLSPGRRAAADHRPSAVSAVSARMEQCPPDPSAWPTYPPTSPASSCWWATRSCSSAGPSARSPPRRGAAIRRWSRSSGPVPR
jgi:competence protein ComEC